MRLVFSIVMLALGVTAAQSASALTVTLEQDNREIQFRGNVITPDSPGADFNYSTPGGSRHQYSSTPQAVNSETYSFSYQGQGFKECTYDPISVCGSLTTDNSIYQITFSTDEDAYLQLDGVFSVSSSSGGDIPESRLRYRVTLLENGNSFYSYNYAPNSSDAVDFIDDISLTAGNSYELAISSTAIPCCEEWRYFDNHDFQGVITTVPVPAAVWLFGSALAGLGWMRRRQQS